MPETRFADGADEVSWSSRTEIGQIATSDSAGEASLLSRYSRRVPATSASTMSLTVHPKTFLTRLSSESGTRANAVERWAVTEAVHGVLGAERGAAPTSFSGARRPCTTRATDWAVRPTSGSTFAARRPSDAAAKPRSSRSLGMCSVGSSTGSEKSSAAIGSRSNRWTRKSAPEAPSMALWCTLVMTPTRSCLSPSTTHISHRGLVRSSGAPAICPASSASSRRPPGAGAPILRRW